MVCSLFRKQGSHVNVTLQRDLFIMTINIPNSPTTLVIRPSNQAKNCKKLLAHILGGVLSAQDQNRTQKYLILKDG